MDRTETDPSLPTSSASDTSAGMTRQSTSRTPPLVRVLLSLLLVLATAANVSLREPFPRHEKTVELVLEQSPSGRWRPAPNGSIASPGIRRALAICVADGYATGFVWPVWFEGSAGVRLHPRNFSPSPAEHAAMTSASSAIFVRRGNLPVQAQHFLSAAPMFNGGGLLLTGILPALVFLACLVLAWVVMPWDWIWKRLTRYVDPACCAECRYPLQGLPTRLCPECGHDNTEKPKAKPSAGPDE